MFIWSVGCIPLKANKDKKASAKANDPKEPTGQWDLSHSNLN